ncbi:MAG: DUF751 domain-containing protein [Lachnospiraceae bacterium]|nr:DUF751 domain-containing protein [Lachnospiraceae bacterium]
MKKETVSYVRHIMGSDYVQLDFFNVLLAVAIIVVSFIAFISGNIMFFGVSFILGDALVFFNMIKAIMKKTATGVAVFGVLFIGLAGVVFFLFKYLI